jgi:hypothetical protein
LATHRLSYLNYLLSQLLIVLPKHLLCNSLILLPNNLLGYSLFLQLNDLLGDMPNYLIICGSPIDCSAK